MDKPLLTLIIFVSTVLLTALILLIIRFFEPRNKLKAYRKLQELSQHFAGSKVRLLWMKPSLKGQYKGSQFVVKYDIRYRYRRGYYWRRLKGQYDYIVFFDLYLPRGLDVKILVYQKLLGTVLMLKKVHTGYQEIDNVLYMFSNSPNEARNYFQSDVRRTTILYLAKHGWASRLVPIRIGKNKISLSKKIIKSELDQNFINETLEKLVALKT